MAALHGKLITHGVPSDCAETIWAYAAGLHVPHAYEPLKQGSQVETQRQPTPFIPYQHQGTTNPYG